MTNSEKTRNESYQEVISDKEYLNAQQTKVYNCFKNGGKTLRDVSIITGIDLHLVSARVSELRQKNLIVETAMTKISEVTNKKNTIFELK